MKKFVKKITVLMVLVSILTGSVNYMYICHSSNFGTMGDYKNDSAYIVDVPEKIEICNFGNSHGYYGFNYEDYSDDYNCFNFSLPSQSMSYNYRILENYQDNISQNAIVFICISYTSFFGGAEIDSSDFESKNKRYYHFLDRKYIKEYDVTTNLLLNYFPALCTDIVDIIKTILDLKRNEDVWNRETSKEEAMEHGFKRYEGHVASAVDEDGNRIFNKEEIQSAYDMIDLCKEIGAIPILIITPYLSEYTEAVFENDSKFYDDFYGVMEKIQKDTGVKCYDYQFDARFASNYSWFINTDHLNREGARNFVDILMQEVVSGKRCHFFN